MHNFSPKNISLTLIAAAAVLFWRVGYPAILSARNVSATDAAGTAAGIAAGATSSAQSPAIGDAGLAADISAQDAIGSATTTSTDNTSTANIFTTNPPGVDDAETLVADLTTSRNYLAVNTSERWPMASISKLMTAVVATDLLSPGEKVTITAQMTAADPTEHILNVGDTYTVSDLLRVMLLPSNNVAAESLAEFYGRARFIAAMNAKAQAWGMTNTYYDDPSGLSAGNESTANDLLKLAQNIYSQYPQVLAITRMPQATVDNLATGGVVMVKSINNFAGGANFIGGKTGYTDQADGNLLSIFNYQGRPIFIVVLGIQDGVRFNGTQTLYNWFKVNFT